MVCILLFCRRKNYIKLLIVTSNDCHRFYVILTVSRTLILTKIVCMLSFGSLVFKGWFAATELYYGAYTNETFEKIDGFEYNLPLAYLCVGGGYLLLCLIMLVYR